MSITSESPTTTMERIVGDGVNVTLYVTEPLTAHESGVLLRWLEHMANCCGLCRQDQDHSTDHDSCTQPDDDSCCCNRRP